MPLAFCNGQWARVAGRPCERMEVYNSMGVGSGSPELSGMRGSRSGFAPQTEVGRAGGRRSRDLARL
jgi:hypothetical protein